MQHTAAARDALVGGPLASLSAWMQQPDPDNLERFARAAAFSVFASGASAGDTLASQRALELLAASDDAKTRIWCHGSLAVALSMPAPSLVCLAAVLVDTLDLNTGDPHVALSQDQCGSWTSADGGWPIDRMSAKSRDK